jgi:hypothetical protein
MKTTLQDGKVGDFDYEILRTVSVQATGGAEIGECAATVSRIQEKNMESWIQAWRDTAERVACNAESALQSGQVVTARLAFFRASNYYRAAVFYVSSEDARHVSLWTRSRQCCHQAISLMSDSVEVLSIPFEGVHLPGYFVKGGTGRRSTLIALGGFDSTGEELLHWIGLPARERGWNCIVFEGPGQWGALQMNPGLTFRPDYEAPVHAVVDYALTRPDVDAKRLALIGYSLGGYFAPRAAACEPRILACIADSLVVDAAQLFRELYPPLVLAAPSKVFDLVYDVIGQKNTTARWALDHARWAIGLRQPHELTQVWDGYSLWPFIDQLRCPLLCLFGEDEIAAASHRLVSETLRFLRDLTGKRTVHVFGRDLGAASHCQMGGLTQAHAVIFCWLDRVLDNKGAEAETGLSIPEDAKRMFELYHGKREWIG